MQFELIPLTADHREAVIDIFNNYVEHSFAAYPETPVPYAFFDLLMQMSNGFPRVAATDERGQVVGFGMLRAYHPLPAFAQTVEISYFIAPEYTGHGIGRLMLHHFECEAIAQGFTVILASISSLNDGSIRFHQQNGFTECGRFQGIGNKHGQVFDVVWMQKIL